MAFSPTDPGRPKLCVQKEVCEKIKMGISLKFYHEDQPTNPEQRIIGTEPHLVPFALQSHYQPLS